MAFKRLFALAAFSVACALAPLNAAFADKADDEWKLGKQLYDQHKMAEAVYHFNQCARLNPKHPWVYYDRGKVFRDQNDRKHASVDFQRSMQVNPNSYAAWDLGKIYASMDNQEEALKWFNEAARLNPKDEWIYEDRGCVYQAMGRQKEAVEDFTLSLKYNPTYETAYFNRAGSYMMLGEHQKAVDDCSKILATSKTDWLHIKTYRRRSEANEHLGQWRKAIEDETILLKLNPADDSILTARAKAYAKLGDCKSAIADLTQLLKFAPEDDDTYRLRAELYIRLGDYKKALEDYSQAIKVEPAFSELNFEGRARVYDKLGQRDLAEKDRKTAQDIRLHNKARP